MMEDNLEFKYFKSSSGGLGVICIINNKYVGKAICHPKDKDMESQLTGEEIAYRRATIEKNKGELKALYTFILQSNYKKSIRVKTQKLIKELEKELANNLKSLDKYIKDKEELYKKIRRSRDRTFLLKNKN